MKTAIRSLLIAGVVFTLGIVSVESVQAFQLPGPDTSVTPSPTTTLWNFLGIPQAKNRIYDRLINRRGEHPLLERKDPILRIADPANLESEVPAIKAAAEIKADADLAKQKIKAIKYLSEVGCTCSSQKVDVQEALLAALDDCTEEVRYEAALAFCRTAGNPCCACGSSCCGEDVTAKLKDMAFGQDDEGCWHELSGRVRAAAMNALNACERIAGPTEADPPIRPRERPVEQTSTAPPSFAPPIRSRERPVEQASTAPRSFAPPNEAGLRMPLLPLMPTLGKVNPASFDSAGKTKTPYSTSLLRQPNSIDRAAPRPRFRGAVVSPEK